MSLPSIPRELVLLIAEQLPAKDLKHLLETNRLYADLLTPLMHKHAMDDKSGLTALQWASRHGHERLALFVLEKGANVDEVKEAAGMTPLHYAALEGRFEMVKILIDHGADINKKTKPVTPATRSPASRVRI